MPGKHGRVQRPVVDRRGWACDAAAGSISRPHLDIDVVVLRPDVAGLSRFCEGWDARLARKGTLVEWDGREFGADDYQVWLRPDDGHRPTRWQEFASAPGFFEVLVEHFDAAEGMWEFRRHRAVSDRVERLGVPGRFLSPEVALLYKAGAATAAQADFDHVVGHLDSGQRAWLVDALERAFGPHEWIPLLG